MKIALHLLAVALFCLRSRGDCQGRRRCGQTQGRTNGQARASKWAEMAEKNFKTLDKDGDGALTFDEFKGNRRSPKPSSRPSRSSS